MKNLRVIYDNAADRATLTATPVVAELGSANLKIDDKFRVCRALGKTLTIQALWPSFEVIGGVALPFSNLSPTATIRVRAYAANGTTTVFDSGKVLACPAPATRLRGWTEAASASAYGHGGGACARLWLNMPVKTNKLVIDLIDNDNLQGFIEAGRLVAGNYWEPSQGAEVGATITMVDTSRHVRTEAGSLITESGTRHKKQSLPLPYLGEKDRVILWNILTGNGMANPIFISVYPHSADFSLEKMHEMYGKLVQTPIMTTPYFNASSATIEIEEI